MQGTCHNLDINLRPLGYQTKTIANLFKTISFTRVYSEKNVEADAYWKKERKVSKGSVIIEECMDEIIYVSESIIQGGFYRYDHCNLFKVPGHNAS